jgi:hypothetical protein
MFIKVLFLIIFAAGVSFSQEKRPSPQDFAGTMEITGDAGSILVFEIPEQVYRGLEREDMWDIRIFDANGIPVPFTKIGQTPEWVTLPPQQAPFFVWKGARSLDLPNERNVEISVSGAVVNVRNAQNVSSVPVSYLVDLSHFPRPPNTLRPEFDTGEAFFESAVSVYTSSDLNSWVFMDKKQTVAHYGDSDADMDTFEISDYNTRYALIRFDEDAPPLLGVTAFFAPEAVYANLKETRVTGLKSRDGMSVFYDTMGYYPIHYVDFRLTHNDSILVNVRNQLRHPGGQYRINRRERLFRLDSASGIRSNNPIPVINCGRYWTLSPVGDIPFSGAPECYIIWNPLQIAFLARGEGPWTLAYGNRAYFFAEENTLYFTNEDVLLPAVFTGKNYYTQPVEFFQIDWLIIGVLWGPLIIAAAALLIFSFYISRRRRPAAAVQ